MESEKAGCKWRQNKCDQNLESLSPSSLCLAPPRARSLRFPDRSHRHRRMGDASGPSCGGDDEWEICNDNGFVYKRRRRLIRPGEAAEGPSTAEDPEVELRRHCRARRRRCLLDLRDRYRQELEQWDLLSSALVDLAAPPPPAAASSSRPEPPSVELPEPPGGSIQQPLVDDLLHQVLDRCEEDNFIRVRVRVRLPGPINFSGLACFRWRLKRRFSGSCRRSATMWNRCAGRRKRAWSSI